MARPAWTAQCTNRKLIGELLPVRRRESHKGDYGRVLLLCGSEGLTGAARLAAKAALRTGSGLVYLGVPEKIYPIIAAGAGSEIVFPLPCDEAGRLCMAALPAITARLPEMDAVLLGPGLGRSEELTRLVQAVLSVCRAPLVLDADGINAAAPHIDVLRGCACPVVLTPHDGEFLRLGGDPKAADRTQEAMRLADRTHAVLLLKGSRTVITDGLNVYVNHTGNPGLAAGGGRQHDDLANGKALRDGYALHLLHGPTSSVCAELRLQLFQRPVLIRAVDGDGDGLPLLDAEGHYGHQPRQLRRSFPAGDRDAALIRLCRAHERAGRARVEAHGVLDGILKFFHRDSL